MRGCDVTKTLSESEPNFLTGVFRHLQTGQRRDSFVLRKNDVTNEPYRRHVVVTLSNRPLRRRTFGPKQLANQTRCDRRFLGDLTTGRAPSRLQVTLLHLKRRAGDRTGRVLDRRALASQDFRAVFSQDHVEDRRHVRAEFRCRDVTGRRVTADRRLRGALDTHAGTSLPQTASRTNRRDVVDRPVTSISTNFAFFFFKSNARFFYQGLPPERAQARDRLRDRFRAGLFFYKKYFLGPRTEPTLPIESTGKGEQLSKKESLSKMSEKSEKTPFAKKQIAFQRNEIFEKFQRFRNLDDRPCLLTSKSARSRQKRRRKSTSKSKKSTKRSESKPPTT